MYTYQIQDMYNNIDDDYGPLMGVYMLLFFLIKVREQIK